MAERIIEVEADSLQEARIKAKSQVPEGLQITSEEILSDGKTSSKAGIADTIEAAFTDAESKLPSDVEIVDRKQHNAPNRKVVTVEAFEGQTARAQVEQSFKFMGPRIESMKLKETGRKGFLGRGKKPNTYEIQVFEPAWVTVVYNKKARIRVNLAESPEHWARRLKEKKDYRALAEINNSKDYDEPFHWRKRDIANRILVESGAEAVDHIIEELATDGVGSADLAEVLVTIGDPKAVPILRKKLDRGEFSAYISQVGAIRKFVEKYPELAGEVEMVECAICGKTRPVTETDYTQLEGKLNRFCKDTCWEKRGRIIGSKDGVGCPYYTKDRMCTAGRAPARAPAPSHCTFSLKIGPSYIFCNVYKIHPFDPLRGLYLGKRR